MAPREIEGQIRRVILVLVLGALITLFVLAWGLWEAQQTGHFDTVYIGGVSVLLFVVLGTVGSSLLVLQYSVMLPLVRLAEALKLYTAGDHSIRLKSDKEDAVELQQIQKTFNEFAEQMQLTLGQLRRVDQERSELTATLTHELRTPLTSVRGYTQLVREGDAGPLTEDQAKFLDLVIQGCDRLNRLVDQVLEVEKKEAEGAWSSEFSLAPVDLPALLKECVEVVSPLARERKVSIELELQPLSGLVSDSFRLRQVFLNLISNAVKYNRQGGAVRIRSLPSGASAWRIEIEDTGLGLTEGERQALFKKFYRTEEAKGSGVQGSGLGLYITQKWVESLGGRIEVQSEKGVGTRFFVTLPCSTPLPPSRTG